MADIVLLFVLKGRDCMSKVLIEVLVIILIAGSYLILYSAVRVSAIADQRIAEIQKREIFDIEKQLNTKQSSILGGMAMANKENKIEGRLGYNSENGRYGLLVSDLWEHTGFHCGECWPAIPTIAEKIKLSEATVRRAIKDLKKAGVIETEQRYRTKGGKSSLLYRVKK